MAKKTNKNQKKSGELLQKKHELGSFTMVEDGKVTVSFDFTKAEVPNETYSASYAFLKDGPNHDVFMIFAQVDAIDNDVTHNLQIRFDDLSLLNLWANSKNFYNKISNWYKMTYGQSPQKQKIEINPKKPHFQLTSNLAFFGHNNTAAIVAFYYFDPRAARLIALGKKPDSRLVSSPVVQVKLNTNIVWMLLNDIEEYTDNLINKYPSLKKEIPDDESQNLELKNDNK